MALYQQAPNDPVNMINLVNKARHVSEHTDAISAVLFVGARGAQACSNAARAVSAKQEQLEAALGGALAGALPLNSTFVFLFSISIFDMSGVYRLQLKAQRDQLVKTCKAIVDHAKALTASAASTQLAVADACDTIGLAAKSFVDDALATAASLGGQLSEAQVLLFLVALAALAALTSLLEACRLAVGQAIKVCSIEASFMRLTLAPGRCAGVAQVAGQGLC